MFIPRTFSELAVIYKNAGFELVLVGGAVRDLLLSIDPLDLDFATDARPQDSIRVLRDAGLRPLTVGAEYGSIHVEQSDKRYEITTYRKAEHYERGSRRPKVRYGSSLTEDLWRRDLTINAMAMRPDGRLFDPYGGSEDLVKRVLRVPAEAGRGAIRAMASLDEDPLRILRVVRYGARYNAEPDQDLESAMAALAPRVEELPIERAVAEIEGLLLGTHPDHGLRLMRRYGLIDCYMPQLLATMGCEQPESWHNLDVWEHTLAVVRATAATPLLRWSALVHDIGKPVVLAKGGAEGGGIPDHARAGAELWWNMARGLRLQRKLIDEVLVLQSLHSRPGDIAREGSSDDATLRRLAAELPAELIAPLLGLAYADVLGQRPEDLEEMMARLDHIRERMEALEAQGQLRPSFSKGFAASLAKELGIGRGPQLGRVMDVLRQAMIDGAPPIGSTPERCARWLEEVQWNERKLT